MSETQDQAPESPEPSSAPDTRRGFLKKATLGVSACLGAAATAPLVGALLTPLKDGLVRLEGTKIDAGPVDAFGPVPKKVVVATSRRDAWVKTDRQVVGAIYVRKDPDGQVTAFSAICPHASCAVSFEEQKQEFVCPCHNTYFKSSGDILRGPSPRSLDTLPVTVEDQRVLVQYQQFRPGISEKIPV